MLVMATGWAAMTQVDVVTRASGRVVPDGREQLIASLEGGILRQVMVRKGQQANPVQRLAPLDPTPFEGQPEPSAWR